MRWLSGSMPDVHDPTTRSRNMAAIRGRDTKPELQIRSGLHRLGYRFRVNRKDLPGKPDIVLSRFHAVIFVHGCFWHRHEGCGYASTPATRSEFWQAKFAANVARDSSVRGALLDEGWRVATIWECALRKPKQVSVATNRLAEWLVAVGDTLELGETEASANVKEGEDVGSSR